MISLVSDFFEEFGSFDVPFVNFENYTSHLLSRGTKIINGRGYEEKAEEKRTGGKSRRGGGIVKEDLGNAKERMEEGKMELR